MFDTSLPFFPFPDFALHKPPCISVWFGHGFSCYRCMSLRDTFSVAIIHLKHKGISFCLHCNSTNFWWKNESDCAFSFIYLFLITTTHMILINCSGEKFSRWYWRQQILWLSWSSQQVGSCLSESVIVGGSVRMRSRDLFLTFIILLLSIWVEEQYLIRFCFTQARYFFQQLICGVSYCHHMVRTLQMTSVLTFKFLLSFTAGFIVNLLQFYVWAKL